MRSLVEPNPSSAPICTARYDAPINYELDGPTYFWLYHIYNNNSTYKPWPHKLYMLVKKYERFVIVAQTIPNGLKCYVT